MFSACLTATCHFSRFSVLFCDQAWLTEIHEYAQQDVVLMLLGNKARHYEKYLEATSTVDRHAKVGCETFLVGKMCLNLRALKNLYSLAKSWQ